MSRARPHSRLFAGALAAGMALTAAAGVAVEPVLSARPPAADPMTAGRPYCKLFLDVDGLPQNTVHALMVDREGSLWVGTQDGAAAYDGKSWKRLDLPQPDLSNFVRTLIEARDGSLWIGRQAGGLAHYRDGQWLDIDFGTTGLAEDRVNALLETQSADGKSLLWVGTAESGLLRFDGENWTGFGPASGLPSGQVWSLLETGGADGGRLWIGTTAGPATLRLADGRIEVPAGAPQDSVSSLLETISPEGVPTVWVGTYGGGLLRWNGGSWSRLGLAEDLPSLFVTDLAASPSGGPDTLWIATDGGGVAQFADGRIRPIELGALLASRAVYKILETRAEQGAQSVWLGTRNNGLIRMTEGLWRAFQPFPETPNVPVTAILQRDEADGSTSLWLGTDGYGVAVWRAGAWKRIDSASGAIGNNTVLALAESRATGDRRRVWVGARNGGLSSFDGERWRRFDQAGGALPSDLVQAVLETVDNRGRGTLWVGTRNGLAAFDGERWRRSGSEPGFPAVSILSLVGSRDPAGGAELWVGTTNGLYRFAGGSWQNWNERADLRNSSVQSLHVSTAKDGRRTLWIGTDGGGIALLAMDEPMPMPRPLAGPGTPALPSGSIYSILEDRERRIYVSTNSGVSRLTPIGAGFRKEEFSSEHGLPLNQGNRGAGLVDARGRLWIGTIGGAAAFDPAEELHDQRMKRLRLDAKPAGCASCALFDRGVLAHDQNRVQFRYTLLSFFGESLTRYRTQLVGYEESPSPWSAEGSREVAALAPGRYVFRLWGRDAFGNVSGPEELAFLVRPAPWQTRWAQLLGLCIAALAIWLFVRVRSRTHLRREHSLEELVDARTRQLKRANELLVDLSYVDALTSVPNRRRFDDLFGEEWKRCLRAGSPIALVMLDIDSFKGYNDSYGHLVGDACLKSVALCLADGLVRSGDAIARYGGEEFAVILPATEVAGALLVAEHLRRRVERLGIPTVASKASRVVTVSAGVAATVPSVEQDPAELFRRADEALYRAKRAGGNATQTG
ncbi:MAG: diguanylate cyclase [Thermoanaerobaculia bacterium]